MALIFWSSLIIHSSSSKCKDLLLSSHISVVLLNKFRVTCVCLVFEKSYRKRRRRCAAVIAVTLTLSDVELLFASWAMESWCDGCLIAWIHLLLLFVIFIETAYYERVVDINKVGRAASPSRRGVSFMSRPAVKPIWAQKSNLAETVIFTQNVAVV